MYLRCQEEKVSFLADKQGSCFTMCFERFRCESNRVLMATDASGEHGRGRQL